MNAIEAPSDASSTGAGPSPRPDGALRIFFSYGFRPFFLLGAIFAVAAMGLFLFWIGVHHAGGQVIDMTIAMAPHEWHAHEMLFGFTMAIICGFFLTAVPNWTGSHAVQGPMLALLVALWLAGRLAMGFSASLPPLARAVLDLSLIPVLVPLVVAAMMRNWSKRNFIFLPILAILFAANLLTHLEYLGIMADGQAMGLRLGLDVIILLISIIGGRVVPAFTTNALRNRGETDLPVNHAALNITGIVLVAAFMASDLADPSSQLTGWLAIAAAAANGLRLLQWKGHKTLGQPILWVLHLGFAWLVAGLALKGLSTLGSGIGPQAALHALTAGAIGTMTLAIMSRAALGHTGRPLVIGGWTVAAYALISLGALVRVVTPLWFFEAYNQGMILAGGCWAGAFAIFTVVYWPVLTGPRISARR
jgi:uncharacterized protein involved in response to NO